MSIGCQLVVSWLSVGSQLVVIRGNPLYKQQERAYSVTRKYTCIEIVSGQRTCTYRICRMYCAKKRQPQRSALPASHFPDNAKITAEAVISEKANVYRHLLFMGLAVCRTERVSRRRGLPVPDIAAAYFRKVGSTNSAACVLIIA